MPNNRPTLTELIERAEAEVSSHLAGADPRLRRSFLFVLTRALAGGVHGLYGFLDFMFKQCFPDTAEAEFLARWASIWGIVRKAATKSGGNIKALGTNGSTISIATELTRSDGRRFVTTALGTIAGGEAIIPVQAVLEGKDGNTGTSSQLTFVSTPSGVQSISMVESPGLFGGTDVESDERLLQRLLDRIQTPPQGGSADDYITWALEVPGVTRAWTYEELGPGTVTVRFMMDDTYSNGIPLAGDVTNVFNYIEARRPVTADVTVAAPIAAPINFTIDLGSADTAAIRAAVDAELRALLARDAEPAATILLSRINEAISIATGETDHVLTVPAANVTNGTGLISTMGTITWT